MQSQWKRMGRELRQLRDLVVFQGFPVYFLPLQMLSFKGFLFIVGPPRIQMLPTPLIEQNCVTSSYKPRPPLSIFQFYFRSFSSKIDTRTHGLRTPNEAFFLKSRNFGLGQTNWTDKFQGVSQCPFLENFVQKLFFM